MPQVAQNSNPVVISSLRLVPLVEELWKLAGAAVAAFGVDRMWSSRTTVILALGGRLGTATLRHSGRNPVRHGTCGWQSYGRGVNLPFQPPIEPMLARLTDEIPVGEGWQCEPEWDGFRALVLRDGEPACRSSQRTSAFTAKPSCD